MMTRIELIKAGMEVPEIGEGYSFQFGWDLYDDKYINFVGVELFDGTLIECEESHRGVAFLGESRNRADEAYFLKAHSAKLENINHHIHGYDDEPSFDPEGTAMVYRSKCGLFLLKLYLEWVHHKAWDEICILPARTIDARELDAHMIEHYPELWEDALIEFEANLPPTE